MYMRFGLALESFTPPGRNPSFDTISEMTLLAESLGYESAWVWDHILLGSRKVFPVLDSLTTLAALGARTSKIELGTSVLIMALRNPVVLAKALSTIQYITKGRLVLGAASGWYEREFRAVGVNFAQRGRIFEERFKLVRRLLNESDVNYSSIDGVSIEHASMEPKPTTSIPMLIGGYSDAVLSRVGKIADGWISYYYTPQGYKDSWEKVALSATKNNRDPDTMKRVNIVPLSVASTYDEGDRLARDFTQRYMDLPKGTLCSVESSIRGTPKNCIEQIREYEAAGVQELVFIPCNYDASHLEKAAKEIIPSFKHQGDS